MEKTVTQKSYNSLSFYEEKEDSMGLSALVDRSCVPASHKRIADGYMFIKKMYGSFMTYSHITNEERNILWNIQPKIKLKKKLSF